MIHKFYFIQSSMLDSCEYDDKTSELSVTFKNGRTYIYIDVSKDIYNNLIDAKSAGAYFNSIKNELKVKA